jgi:TonB family protein
MMTNPQPAKKKRESRRPNSGDSFIKNYLPKSLAPDILMRDCSMHRFSQPRLSLLILALLAGATTSHPASQQTTIEQLEIKLKSQYAKIEKVIASPPSPRQYPVDYRRYLREWQDDLAQSFVAAATTIAEILKLNPSNADFWRERLETLQLYSQPVSSPDERKVFGSGEVQKSAAILEANPADYTDEARAAKTHGEVRLRLVLTADGTVKNIFPFKSLGHGLTEAAMNAARQIKFEPAVRNGKPASQFLTLVYEFQKGQSRPPYIPKTEF